ncbi:hypothetical protein C7T94_05910 [Pedobacter yulinensis]|uniref:ABC transporter ATP-binding protein n=1 Tax=Pedobacter yulinensis TaxID=2126353 RepID=A0A2T3HP81_9SPHI|nr:ABC transporter ATP-binding protein [Pedobacter yulinensis]PST84254.1 hypothetical protein C7T94_05910 [Pedobacter yulinensis]
MELIRQFYKYLQPHRSGLLLVFLLLGVSSAGSLVSPYVLKIIIDDILPHGSFSDLIVVLGVLVGVYLIRIACTFVTDVWYTKMGQQIIAAIQADINRQVLHKPLSFFKKTKAGDMTFLLMNDVGVIQSSLFSVLLKCASDLLTLAGIVAMLLILDFRLASISLVIVPLLLVISKRFTPVLQNSFRRIQEVQERLNTYFLEVFRNHRVVKSYNSYVFEAGRLQSLHGEILDKTVKNAMLTAANSNVITFLVAVGPVIVLMFGGYRIFYGAMTVGSLVAFVQYLNRLYAPAMSLANTYNGVNKALVSMQRIADFMEYDVTHDAAGHTLACKSVITHFNRISFRDVSLKYGDRSVLQHVDLQFNRGEMVGLSGPSGSGKSSIVNLLCGFLQPDDGLILLDDRLPLHQVSNWADHLGLVEKCDQLFHVSLAENIRYGQRESGSAARLMKATRDAEFFEVMNQMPEGLNTLVSETGSGLSDGQRQRISIARALHKDTAVMIIDESTSSLDLALERRIILNIRQSQPDAILIMISHRPASLALCDRVYFIEDGYIVREKTPDNQHEFSFIS